jgi:hypothetical protein
MTLDVITGTPISQLPLAAALTGAEQVPMVQAGNTVRASVAAIEQAVAPANPLPINEGGTGKQSMTPNALQVGASIQQADLVVGNTGQILVGDTNAPPRWIDPGEAGQLLKSNGVDSDPSWIEPGYLTGPIGPQGAPGIQGVQGPMGNQGPQGVNGVPGPSGQVGPAGPPAQFDNVLGSFTNNAPSALPPSGFIPANWDSGSNPVSPLQFYPGQSLIYTVTGHIWGFVGTRFNPAGWVDLGAMVGPPGPQGIQGTVGPQGVQGIQGVPGAQGAQGAQGSQGSVGPAGPQGAEGPQGIEGAQGPMGSQGIPGPQGIQGTTGSQGAPGQTVSIIGAFTVNAPSVLPPAGNIPANWDSTGVPPTPIQMQNGQGLVYTVTGEVWLWVGTGITPAGWVDMGSIVGPTGPTGPQGTQGVQGPAGADGAEGPPGPTGSQGGIGPAGAQGDQGVAGPVGPQGAPGQSAVIVGQFGASKVPSDLPTTGIIPANWDAPGVPPATLNVTVGEALVYTANEHVWVYVSTAALAAGWIDIGATVGPQGPTGPTGPQGPAGPVPEAPTDGASYARSLSAWTSSPTFSGSAVFQSTVTLAANPTVALGAAPKQYVDGGDATVTSAMTALANSKLPLAGGTMTGPIVLAADPTAALQASTKQYVDAGVGAAEALANTMTPLAGATMTGPLILSADPTANLGAATKEYVDNAAQTVLPVIAAQGVTGGFINKLRNGTFDIWQRGTSTLTIAAGASGYTADGWIVAPIGDSVITQYQGTSNARPGFRSSTLILITLGGTSTSISLTQRIEASICYPLNGAPVTFQIWIYNGTTSTITPTATLGYATSFPDVWTGGTTIDQGPVNLQSIAPNAWGQCAYTFAAPSLTAINNGLCIILGLPGINSSEFLQVGEADLRSTPAVTVGLNNNPPPAELRPYPTELAFCQRYFESSFGDWAIPTITNSGMVQYYSSGLTSGLHLAILAQSFKATKRTEPTITVYSPTTNAVGKVHDFQNNVDLTPSGVANAVNIFNANATQTTASTVVNMGCHWVASAEL